MRIDAKGLYYKDLNEKINLAIENGAKEIILDNINGQRYIGAGLKGNDIKITIFGTPGNDLACFMDGPTIVVNSNAQDGVGNTMNAGKVIVYGDAGDIAGHSMRGGKIFIQGDVGYRVGIHMKVYKDLYPVIIIGGRAGDFLGEYMAGGLIIVLGLRNDSNSKLLSNYVGTGMHGGRIFIRSEIKEYQVGKEVKMFPTDREDKALLETYLKNYCQDFSLDLANILDSDFMKLLPHSGRPYGKIYSY